MHTRHLSQTLTVSSIGYGAMGLSEFYGQTDDTASLQLLHAYRPEYHVYRYSGYVRRHNERLIGHFLAGLDNTTREQFKIATKCGIDRPADRLCPDD